MTTTEHFPAVASGQTPDRRGQGTMVEQARAATQVQMAVLQARQYPRDTVAAKRRLLEACAPGLAAPRVSRWQMQMHCDARIRRLLGSDT